MTEDEEDFCHDIRDALKRAFEYGHDVNTLYKLATKIIEEFVDENVEITWVRK